MYLDTQSTLEVEALEQDILALVEGDEDEEMADEAEALLGDEDDVDDMEASDDEDDMDDEDDDIDYGDESDDTEEDEDEEA